MEVCDAECTNPCDVGPGRCRSCGLAGPTELAADRDGEQKIALMDDCDPDDPGVGAAVRLPAGQGRRDAAPSSACSCVLPSTTTMPARSTAGLFLVGHPSWRNEPSHLVVEEGKRIQVKNEGGRPHTFTPVAQFGGGRVPPLLVGTQPAPECAARRGRDRSLSGRPGRRLKLKATTEGIQRFLCCFHPWMRATVRVIAGRTPRAASREC